VHVFVSAWSGALQGGSIISAHSMGFYCIENMRLFFSTMGLKGIKWSPSRTRIPIGAAIRGNDCFAEALHFNDGMIVQTKVPSNMSGNGFQTFDLQPSLQRSASPNLC
jgi:hypothetical protein